MSSLFFTYCGLYLSLMNDSAFNYSYSESMVNLIVLLVSHFLFYLSCLFWGCSLVQLCPHTALPPLICGQKIIIFYFLLPKETESDLLTFFPPFFLPFFVSDTPCKGDIVPIFRRQKLFRSQYVYQCRYLSTR
jgi:hypothetical protein